jgi:hypothetical protein
MISKYLDLLQEKYALQVGMTLILFTGVLLVTLLK